MKSLPHLLPICLLLIAFVSCNQGTPNAPEISQLHGSWQWLSSVGGIKVEHRTPQSTGHNATVTFANLDVVFFCQDSVLQSQFHYTVTKQTPYLNGPQVYVIEYVGALPPENKQMVSYRGVDTLLLTDLYIDGYQSIYVRIAN